MAARKISALVEIGAVMASNVKTVFGGLNKYIDQAGKNINGLKKQTAEINKLQTAQMKLSVAQFKGNTEAVKKYQSQIYNLSDSLRAAGVDVANLQREKARLNGEMDRSAVRIAKLGKVQQAYSSLGSTFAKTKAQVGGLMTKTAVAGAAAGYFFKTQFVDTAAEFERLQTVLKTLEGGDVAKAQQAFGWISKFAAETPFDLKQVTEAFKQLRTYGIDPIKGDTLRILGDTASAMGKDVMQPVEAIADAVMGENQRLKELGISANATKQKGKVTYTYFDRLGKQREKTVDASNKEIMKSTILAIWNEKYAGAMKDQSKTWLGMMSNLGDQWDRFTMRVMAGGLFDWMKGKLGGILETLDKMAEDGSLDKWAKTTGDNITKVFKKLEDWGTKIWETTKATKDLVGGWDNLGIILATVALAPTILSIIQLGFAVKTLTVAVFGLLGPWGLLAGAIVIAATAIYSNWGGMGDWFKKNVSDPIFGYLDGLIEKFNAVKSAFSFLTNTFSPSLTAAPGKSMPLLERMTNPDFKPDASAPQPPRIWDVWDRIKSGKFSEILAPAPEMMPGARMPQASTNNITNHIDVKINAPGADGAAIGNGLRSNLESRPLFDQTTVLSPR